MKRIISVIIMLCFLLSCTATAYCNEAKEVFNVDIDNQNGGLSIFYKNPLYSNNNVGISVESLGAGLVYVNQLNSGKSGAVKVNDIELTDSGIYIVSVYPENRFDKLDKEIIYYSNDDLDNLWDIYANTGSASDIEGKWSDICVLFEVEDTYLSYIDDASVLYNMIASNRGDTVLERNESNIREFGQRVKTWSLITALVQNSDTDSLKYLFGEAMPDIVSADKELAAEWKACSDSDMYDKVLEEYAEIRSSASAFSDIIGFMDKALMIYRADSLLKGIEGCEHISQISAILNESGNAEILLIADWLEDYNDLSSTSYVDDRIANKKFADVYEFAKEFKNLLDKAVQLDNSNSLTSGKGHSPAGGGGSSSGGAVYVAPSVIEEVLLNPFKDIDDVPWAKQHILKLYDMKIINGRTSDSFAPGDNISREELVKLIVLISGLEQYSEKISFDDMVPGAWYEDYVYAAYANKLAMGIGNNKFGIGLNATRQDIAVMILNAMPALKQAAASELIEFKDKSDIAGYALEAVNTLAECGVITGDENGYFNPGSYATRAEVCVMLSRAYDVWNKEGR